MEFSQTFLVISEWVVMVAMLLATAVTIFCCVKEIRKISREEEGIKYLSSAIVTRKEHPEKFNFVDSIRYRKNFVIENYNKAELFNVFLLYDGKEYCINDKDLYEKVKVGDSIVVSVHKFFNKRGKVKRQYITIKD